MHVCAQDQIYQMHQLQKKVHCEIVFAIIGLISGMFPQVPLTNTQSSIRSNVSVFHQDARTNHRSQSKDCWGVQGVIWLVAAAAAATMSYAAGLRVPGLQDFSLVGCSLGWDGGTSVQRGGRIGEDHASCEWCGRGSGRENWGVKRLWLNSHSSSGGRRCKLVGDGYLGLWLFDLHLQLGWGPGWTGVFRLQFDTSQSGHWRLFVGLGVGVVSFANGAVSLQDELQLVLLLLELIYFLLQTWLLILQLVSLLHRRDRADMSTLST